MGKRSPILGYNHNVRHRGVVFHIQTEDSGVQNPHLFTHVFYSGSILASRRLDYDADSDEDVVKALMQAQHKAALKDLRGGAFDEKITQFLGHVPELEPAGPAGLNLTKRAGSEITPEKIDVVLNNPESLPFRPQADVITEPLPRFAMDEVAPEVSQQIISQEVSQPFHVPSASPSGARFHVPPMPPRMTDPPAMGGNLANPPRIAVPQPRMDTTFDPDPYGLHHESQPGLAEAAPMAADAGNVVPPTPTPPNPTIMPGRGTLEFRSPANRAALSAAKQTIIAGSRSPMSPPVNNRTPPGGNTQRPRAGSAGDVIISRPSVIVGAAPRAVGTSRDQQALPKRTNAAARPLQESALDEVILAYLSEEEK